MAWARRVLLKTALTPFTGYGNDGIGLAIALSNAGYDVSLAPSVVTPPLPAPVAALLTRPVEPPYDLFIHHADPKALGLTDGERRAANVTVAWTMWEFSSFGQEKWANTLSERLRNYDVLLPYDDVSMGALEPYTYDGMIKRKLQGGYFAEDWKAFPTERDWSGTFRFCMVGALHQRKNPFATVEAFKSLKEKHGDEFDAELHLKTNIRVFHPAMEETYPWLKIHYVNWPQQKLREFYLHCHCLVAPSWGEGKNLPALEAQTTGLPVIATKIGGHAEWMSRDWSYEAPHTLGEHSPGMASARVSVEGLAEVMWHVYTNQAEARQKGELAARVIPAQCDWSKVVARLEDRTRP